MKNEEHVSQDAHFQVKLNDLKDSVARLTSLLEQALRNASGQGPSTRSAQARNHPGEVIGERIHDPQQHPTFVQSIAPTPILVLLVEMFANES